MNKHNIKKLIIFSACLVSAGAFLFLIGPEIAFAQVDTGITQVGEGIGLPATDIRIIIANIVRAALGLLGIVAVVLMIYAGYLWMTAGGDENNVTRAKKMMINAAIGLAIMLSAYSIVSFVMSKLVEATSSLPPHCFNNVQDTDISLPETGVDCGGECGSCDSGTGNPYLPGGSFFVDTLPLGGEVCIKNYNPTIIFNRPPDLASLDNRIIVEKVSGGVASGNWVAGISDNIAVFKPSLSCAPAVGDDCLEADTDYVLKFVAGQIPFILSRDATPLPMVGCRAADRSVNVANCHEVAFKTGTGVDRNPPDINFIFPDSASALSQGDTVPVSISYTDDNGIQNISLRADNHYVGNASFTGCNRSGNAIINWPTAAIPAGSHLLEAAGTDFAGLNDLADVTVNLRPQHCFDDILNNNEDIVGPPACCAPARNCGCGICSGSSCTNNNQCASGYCDTTSGTCLDRLQIRSVSPISGAPGNYVTIGGLYFGGDPGHIYFSRVANPNRDTAGDWQEATLVNCGQSFDSWMPSQIVAEVPEGSVSGPLLVENRQWATAPVASRFLYKDATDDAPSQQWGPLLSPFTVDSLVRPGICAVVPSSGVSGAPVEIYGRHFGTSLNAGTDDNVYFGDSKAVVLSTDWSDVLVKAAVPGLAPGAVGLKITDNGVESNSVRFNILSGAEDNAPVISDISPSTGAKGEYITISGKNFGSSRGQVWFKQFANSPTLSTNDIFSFPAECANSVWTDTKIIVKFPEDGTTGERYFVQINTDQNRNSLIDRNFRFALQAGEPRPGLCKVDPASGPIPFPASSPAIRLTGEYFGADINNIRGYFWANGASPDTVNGRSAAPTASYVLSRTADNKGDILSLRPSTNVITGPVVVARQSDNKMSNPAAFTAMDCRANNNRCSVDTEHCCPDGSCKAAGDMCAGVVRSTGYVWRFSSRDIPDVPHVVERCTDNAANFPTPAPNVMWDSSATGDHHQVCRGAVITVEFSLSNINNISGTDLVVNECQAGEAGAVNENERNCASAQAVLLDGGGNFDPQTAAEQGDFIVLLPDATYNNGRWKDNTWYQVVLKDGITVGTGQDTAHLAKDRPCSVANSAYCFLFKTDAQDCKMKSVVVMPYSYRTSVIEAPMKRRSGPRDAGEDLFYQGLGLSDQRCIVMNTAGAIWNWTTGNANFASIFGVTDEDRAQVSALANTVGIGVTNPADAVSINARASFGGLDFDGTSPLTIDLNKPEVVDFWPQCQEACLNATVGARFNTSMSGRNLPGEAENGSVQLLKCNDENCLNTTSVLDTDDVFFIDPLVDSSYTILNIANSRQSSSELEADTLYKVVLSATTQDTNSEKLLWSMSRDDHATYAKPLDKEFSWRFRTKKNRCVVDRVEVTPKVFNARVLNSRAIYEAASFSSPDACSRQGQRINPWSVGWNWTSSDVNVATIQDFKSVGLNNNCTDKCIRKGSYISRLDTSYPPICGNGRLEAGEDCITPDKNANCGLNCIFINRTNKGSSPTAPATDVNASICGNGLIGAGEDCDIGRDANVDDPTSAMNCSGRCLHTGSMLFREWCEGNRAGRGGFTEAEYTAACAKSISRCGDGIEDPTEDPGCDVTPFNTNCNDHCLLKNGDAASDIAGGNGCGASPAEPAEGCDEHWRHIGSSLGYTSPSACGDEVVGTGEDAFCETNFTILNEVTVGANPWILTKGVGRGTAAGDPPAQKTDIAAATTVGAITRSGKGQFVISCGYESEAECQASRTPEQIAAGINLGVGSDSCCYEKPMLLPPTVPAAGASGVCPNTYISASFSGELNPATILGNVVLARGENTAATCAEGTTPVGGILLGSSTGSHWYEAITNRLINFARGLFGRSATAGVVTAWCSGGESYTASMNYDKISDTSKIIIKLSELLATSTAGVDYAVALKEGIKSIKGVSIGQGNGNNISWRFTTGQELCKVDSVVVAPPEHLFSRAGGTVSLTADAFATGNRQIQSIPGVYAWNYLWTPATSPFVSLTNTTAENNLVTAQNRNGETDVVATANVTANLAEPAKIGPAGSGRSHFTVLLCENPWPPKDVPVEGSSVNIWPWEDRGNYGGYINNDNYDLINNNFDGATKTDNPFYNFSAYYCADNGSSGLSDDLPFLRVAPQIGAGLDKFLKRIIFTDRKLTTSDAIGIQIFANPDHRTARQWYEADKAGGGQGFIGTLQDIKVAGYDAVTDGNNYYVDALNVTDPTGADNHRNIFSNIYLFSINADARPEMRKVFEQMLANVKFNINLQNSHLCKAVGLPETTLSCNKDSDCPSATPICSAQIDKLKRNYARLRGLAVIKDALLSYNARNGGTYPDMREGTFISGQTISTWPSWAALGNAVGRALPVDPVNQLGKAGTCKNTKTFCTSDSECAPDTCVIHDAATGWSDVDRRFLFSCNTKSYAYRYIFKEATLTSSENFEIRAMLEKPFGEVIRNWGNFVGGFVGFRSPTAYDNNRFKIEEASGICGNNLVYGQENGRCGDRILNPGETCDPPRSQQYGVCGAVRNNKVKVDVCSGDCLSWTPSTTVWRQSVEGASWVAGYVDCSLLSKCGNGVKEAGEDCDMGGANGQTGSGCDANCDLVASTCNNGIDEADELCDTPGYSVVRENSCSWDCKSYGPYCGDGIIQNVQTQGANEECEGSVATTPCTVGVTPGIRKCNVNTCRWSSTCETIGGPLASAPGTCGDGVVGENEACDLGLASNGRACTPSYNQSCTYCSADCRERITVNPAAFCGNGIVETGEVCDFNTAGDIFTLDSARRQITTTTCIGDNPITPRPLSAHTYKIGDKQCINNCSLLQNNCISCGEDDVNGVEVRGEIVNALNPSSNNPLLVGNTLGNGLLTWLVVPPPQSSIKAWIGGFGWLAASTPTTRNYYIRPPDWLDPPNNVCPPNVDGCNNAYRTNIAPVKLNPNPACAPFYKLGINYDNAHRRNFPVYSKVEPGQYDLVLSQAIPVSTASGRSFDSDIRIVVKWMGETGSLAGGFFYPNPAFTPPVSVLFNGPTIAANTGATLDDYYNGNKDHFSTWWHGAAALSSGTNAESFTIHTVPMNYPSYAFYIHSDAPISQFLNTAKLRVEVYFPDTNVANISDIRNLRIFDSPDRAPNKVYEFKMTGGADDVERSANPGATYWHVFNIRRWNIVPNQILPITERVADLSRIVSGITRGDGFKIAADGDTLRNGRIVSGPSQFDFGRLPPCDAQQTCQSTGRTCGMLPDGCGNTEDCGTCTGNQDCQTDGHCACPTGQILCSGVCKTAVTVGVSVCNDNNACTTGETYQDACGTVCGGSSPTNCNDSNACTTDSCNNSSGCKHDLVSGCEPCATAATCTTNVCNNPPTCVAGRCQNGTPITITCPAASAVDCGQPIIPSPVPSCGTCAGKGTRCTTNGYHCDLNIGGGICVPDCTDECASGDRRCVGTAQFQECGYYDTDVCREFPGPSQMVRSCTDGNPCTTDSCTGGVCSYDAPTAAALDDGNPCTDDSCNGTTGVIQHIALANGTSCADADLCDGAETCQTGVCAGGTPVSITDNNVCTNDSCNPTNGLVSHANVANGTSCADADLCDGTETCQAGVCSAGTPLPVSDNNPCTEDSCSANVVKHAPLSAGTASPDCLPGEVCTAAGTCCMQETNAAFCTRIGKECATQTALDNCGISRTASCGICAAGFTCLGTGICQNNWFTGPCGTTNLSVYKENRTGLFQWSPFGTNCVSPQCIGGVLVADNTVSFTDYPARNSCKMIGGRLPSLSEIQCIRINMTSYGSNFSNGNYWTNSEVDATRGRAFEWGSRSEYWAGKGNSYFVRCVKGQ